MIHSPAQTDRLLSLSCTFALLTGSLLATTGCEEAQPTPISTAPPAVPATVSTIQASIHFLSDYRQALEAARGDRRMILLFVTAPWCQYCHEMEAEMLADPTIQQLAQSFVCVRVDADQQTQLCEQFQVSAFPTVQFVSSRGVPLSRMIGKQSTGKLARHMQELLGAVAEQRGIAPVVR